MRLRHPESQEEIERVCRLTTQFLGSGDREELFAFMMLAFAECPFLTPESCFILDVDGEIAASGQMLSLPMQVGGAVVQAAGLQAFVVDPGFRNRDLIKRMFEEGRGEVLRRGSDVSLGFGHSRYYDRMGATPIVADTEVEVRVRDVRGDRPEGFREMDDGEVDLLLDHYAASNVGRTGVIRRSPEYWKWQYRKPPSVRIRDDGYVGYEVREDQVSVLEIGGEGPGFYRDALMEVATLAREENLEVIRAQVPPDHPFVGSVVFFGAQVQTRYHRSGWCMGEVLNVESFLGKIEGELDSRLRVTLPTAPRVRLVVQVDDEEVEVTLPGEGGGDRVVDLPLPRKLFTQLVFGYKDLDTVLAEAGIRRDAESRRLLNALFPKGHPYIWKADRF
ncbi:GNAT family N-acetyltransferase [Gemmatimonadota bacterium]